VLSESGHKSGRARNAMLDLLAAQGCALTALEIEDELRGSDQRVGRASIYRILELLSDRGLINRLDVGDGTARYERVDPGGDHHHHLVCDACGRLVPFDDPDLERSIDRLSRRLGFRLHDHEVVLHGDCAACQA
jgi:Fur family ferric uptake transcriptional regulator